MTTYERYKTLALIFLTLALSAFIVEAILLMQDVRAHLDTITIQVGRLVDPALKAEAAISSAGLTFSQIAAKERNAFDAQQSYYTALGDRTNTLLDEVNHDILPQVAGSIHTADASLGTLGALLVDWNAQFKQFSVAGASVLAGVASDATALRPAIDNLSAITDHGVAISTNLEGLTADAHAESTLIVGRTQKAFAPQNRALAIARLVGGGSLSLAELFYYISRGSF